jgi:stage V sporulation protein SpoVS
MTPETRNELDAVAVNDLEAAVAVARKIVDEDGAPLTYVVIQALILRFDDPDPLLERLDELGAA